MLVGGLPVVRNMVTPLGPQAASSPSVMYLRARSASAVERSVVSCQRGSVSR